jgi:N-acetylglucosamine malate deacetylase 1
LLFGERVLVLAAHMDDEVLGAAGTIHTLVRQHHRIEVCFAANRAYDHVYDEDAIAQEERAARSAQSILGYDDALFLRFDDERLDDRAHDLMVSVEAIVQERRPDTILICHSGDVNQDHHVLARVALVATRPTAAPFVRAFLAYEVPSSTDQVPQVEEYAFHPNAYVPLDREALEAKQKALACYERELRLYPHPRSAEGVEAYARKRGMECGHPHAEAFRLLRAVATTA